MGCWTRTCPNPSKADLASGRSQPFVRRVQIVAGPHGARERKAKYSVAWDETFLVPSSRSYGPPQNRHSDSAGQGAKRYPHRSLAPGPHQLELSFLLRSTEDDYGVCSMPSCFSYWPSYSCVLSP